jgi:hypothetical protein
MANLKISETPANTNPADNVLVPIVTDPSGTPVTEHATKQNFLGWFTTTITSSATPTPTGNGRRNELIVTALAENCTIAAPTGTLAEGNIVINQITATGGTRAVDRNAIYLAGNQTFITSIPAGKTLLEIYRYQNAKLMCHYSDLEA